MIPTFKVTVGIVRLNGVGGARGAAGVQRSRLRVVIVTAFCRGVGQPAREYRVEIGRSAILHGSVRNQLARLGRSAAAQPRRIGFASSALGWKNPPASVLSRTLGCPAARPSHEFLSFVSAMRAFKVGTRSNQEWK